MGLVTAWSPTARSRSGRRRSPSGSRAIRGPASPRRKAIVADIRAGRRGGEAAAYAAALRDDAATRARIAAFIARSGRTGQGPGTTK